MENQFESNYLNAAYIILHKCGKPLGARDIVEGAIRDRLLPDNLNAKTPWKTMHARLSVHIRKYAGESPFLRTAPGLYDLRSRGLDLYETPPRKPPKVNEQVLVFPTEMLDKLGRFQGITKDWQPIFRQLINSSACRYMDRVTAEQDDTHKQIIAYVMVTSRSQILAFKRGSYNRVADFLRGCQCIGFGGHVSHKDYSAFDIDNMGITNCAARELGEEIKLPVRDANILANLEDIRIVGLLNDDSSQNGRRNFAVILQYEASNDVAWADIRRRELSINQLRWLDLTSATFSLWDFEYWSQLCLREYFPQSLHIQPSYKIIRRKALRPPHLLCVVGQLGSGKSTATEILVKEFGYKEVNSGKIIASILGLPSVSEATRAEFQIRAWNFINTPHGPDQLAEAIWSEVIRLESNRVLIDGIRQRATFERLKSLANQRSIGMLYIHTPPDIAYQFYHQRVDSVNSIHDFLKVREAPVESESAELIAQADAVLYNWQGNDTYYKAIRELISHVQK